MKQPDAFLIHENLNKKVFQPPHNRIRSLIIVQPDELILSAEYKYQFPTWILYLLVIIGACTAFLGFWNRDILGSTDLAMIGTVFTVVVPPLTYILLNRRRVSEQSSLTLTHKELKISFQQKNSHLPAINDNIHDIYLPTANIKQVFVGTNPDPPHPELNHAASHEPRIVFVAHDNQQYVFTSKAFSQKRGLPFMAGYTANQELEWLHDIITSFLEYIPPSTTVSSPQPTSQISPPSNALTPAHQQAIQALIAQPPAIKQPATNVTLHDQRLTLENTTSNLFGWKKYVIFLLTFALFLFISAQIGWHKPFAYILPVAIFLPLMALGEYSQQSITRTKLTINHDLTEITTLVSKTPRGPWKTSQNIQFPTASIRQCSKFDDIHHVEMPQYTNDQPVYSHTHHIIRFECTDNKIYDFTSHAFTVFAAQPILEEQARLQEFDWLYQIVSTHLSALPHTAIATNLAEIDTHTD